MRCSAWSARLARLAWLGLPACPAAPPTPDPCVEPDAGPAPAAVCSALPEASCNSESCYAKLAAPAPVCTDPGVCENAQPLAPGQCWSDADCAEGTCACQAVCACGADCQGQPDWPGVCVQACEASAGGVAGGEIETGGIVHLAPAQAGGLVLLTQGATAVELARVDAQGKLAFTSTLAPTLDRQGARLLEADGGGFLVAGTALGAGAAPGFWLVKTTQGGAIIWEFTWPEAGEGHALVQLGSKQLVLVGGSAGAGRILVASEDGQGSLSPAESFGPWHRAVATGTSDAVLLGTKGALGDRDLVLRRITSQGAEVWTQTLTRAGDQSAVGLARTNDSGLVLAATEAGAADGVLLVRTDDSGATSWVTAHPGSAALEVGVTPLGAYVLLAERAGGVWLARLNLEGLPSRELVLPWPEGRALAVTPTGFLVGGSFGDEASWVATDADARPCQRP